jgi:hypothetical protein
VDRILSLHWLAGCAESFSGDVDIEASWPAAPGPGLTEGDGGEAGLGWSWRRGGGGGAERVWRGRLAGSALEFGGGFAGKGGDVAGKLSGDVVG